MTASNGKTQQNGNGAQQLPLGLDERLSHKVFPGRSMLMVLEVATELRITDKQVVSLINEGLLGAVEITGKGNKTSREHWRIPVASYDDYVRRRSNAALATK